VARACHAAIDFAAPGADLARKAVVGAVVEFDYIIVGAGSAGCVLAEGLTANGRHKVLLLEAGGSDKRFWIQTPLGYGKTFYDRSVNWAYDTEVDPGLGGRADYWPRGKVIGGSSSINAMVYIRGHAQDYEDWKAAGNPGWGWDDVLPVFRAMEDTQAGEDQWRGRGGPLHVADVSSRIAGYCAPYIAAGEQAGLPFNPDFNGAQQEGVGYFQFTMKDGRRMSAARAFLDPARSRANLKVETEALVTAVTFDGRRATGVRFLQNGQARSASARREVILAAGAVNSPQLLQRSGIGPGAVLARCGIPVVHENANVGLHMQDHLGINYNYRVNQPTLNERLSPWWGKLIAGAQYLLTRSGPLSLSINHGGGFFRTDPSLDRPNMQLYYQAMSTTSGEVTTERPLTNPDPFPGVGLGLSTCRPTARGHLAIRSADPHEAPSIHANAFGTDHDVEEMLAAVKFLRVLASQPGLAAVIEEELLPGPAVVTDEALIADFRARSGTVYHPSCTCRMGPDAADTVVDARLRVHGMEGLRVVDASAFPNLNAGNTNAPTMMLARKGAGLILEDAR